MSDLPPYVYYKLTCSKCGRKILVEIALIGTNHNLSVIATCADCMKGKLSDEFKKQRPEIYEDIKKWIEE